MEPKQRDISLDITRGLIMVLMALDHTRIFFSSAQFEPTDIDHTNLNYFITRWVTHLCAPGFFFLAGLGAALAERNGLTPSKSSYWLATRGLWLIAIEFTIIGFAWSFNPGWNWFGVIWSLGAAMICLSFLRYLPRNALATVAALVLVVHNALPLEQWFHDQSWFALLYDAGLVHTPIGPKIALFPLIPWLCITVLGYTVGPWLTPNNASSPPRFAAAGAFMIAAFAAFRLIGFGAPLSEPATSFPDAAHTWMSFFNVEKYPPSLQFVLITLGVLFALIALFASLGDTAKTRLGLLHTFGRVPFFFYVLHIYLIHGLALFAAIALGWPTDYAFWHRIGPNLGPPNGYGVALPGVYLAWFAVLLLVYLPCADFAAYKARSKSWWVKYL